MRTLPSLFVSHGAPTFALEAGQVGPLLRQLGQTLPRPRAIVMVSAHWQSQGVRVTGAARPETIHDFRGFDDALYELRYPAPGEPALARQIVEQLNGAGWPTRLDPHRGLDHGAWVPLLHLYADADVPVVQVSLPHDLDGPGAEALGLLLAPLADDNILIIGSGSLTHNLRDVFLGTQKFAYAKEFTDWIRAAVARGDRDALRDALIMAPQAQRAHPTPEHYWPLVVAAAAGQNGPGTLLDGGMTHRVLSMDAFVFGRLPPSELESI
ncbi:DODA-type extradiol aromatic ring-opening family dioxygenase [Wenzhouxiangella marina]|uniref:Aromatic ring-opening dioxygenase LigB n=1 Tax=Wenzhouxiangella marina TaxID=1579979 RepID=A0A0K0XTV5_9GAMM|nr:class III extradiol ring-cleavage dioxygenase [Wenzhouxiangella marina]AKS41144.1 aromatic ring-opening dioxygenase LigB [Wenzhouxiangella marina]MBB6088023.1 4,5-DOPA dioxygenase extradiol [Wenzhouxiangella marina]